MSVPQWDQWISTLQVFVPPIYYPPLEPQAPPEEEEELFSGMFRNYVSLRCDFMRKSTEDEMADGRRLTHAKSWSVIGRKGPHSETSSFVLQASTDDESLFTPGLLPRLFDELQSLPPLRLASPPPDLRSDYGKMSAFALLPPIDNSNRTFRRPFCACRSYW